MLCFGPFGFPCCEERLIRGIGAASPDVLICEDVVGEDPEGVPGAQGPRGERVPICSSTQLRPFLDRA